MLRVALFSIGCMSAGCMFREADGPPAQAPDLDAYSATETAVHYRPLQDGACPRVAPGTSVHAQDVEQGAALVFTTSDDVDELRAGIAEAPPHSVSATAMRSFYYVDGGVRVVFEEPEQGDVEALRRNTRGRAQELAHSCGLSLAVQRRTRVAGAEARPPEPQPDAGAPAAEASRADVRQDRATRKPAVNASGEPDNGGDPWFVSAQLVDDDPAEDDGREADIEP